MDKQDIQDGTNKFKHNKRSGDSWLSLRRAVMETMRRVFSS